MALLQWRKFNFFEVTKEIDKGAVNEALQSADVTCTASGRGCLVFGDSSGLAHFVNRQLEVLSHRLFEARVWQLAQLKFCPVLAAAGEDELGVSSVKVLGLEQLDGGGAPRLLRQLKLPPAADGGTTVTCLAVHENLFMAAGFADGRVILWRGDLTRERAGKHQVLHSGAAPVTGLGFRTSGKTSHLFISTEQEVCCYNITFKDKENQIRLDESGCAARCAVMSEGSTEPQFTVGRPDAIYCYSPNERGACFVFKGEKRLLHWFKGYLVVLGAEQVAGATGGAEATPTERHVMTVYDVANKYVALHVPLRDVQHLVSDWGQLFVVTSTRKLHVLTELDTQAKLQVLFKKNLYDMAIRLAQSQQYDADGLMNIFKEYGDYLHGKGDYSGAVQQYIKTIGKLIPSYVIRKYLDTQRISDLTLYLEALHRGGHASADHTTLLINCYTKLRLTEQLDQFIQGEGGAVEYDVGTAVRVCRSSGYYEQALAMARRHHQTDVVVSILTEDLSDPGRALRYIGQLPHDECESAILRHGAGLLKVKPTDTVELLKKLSCTPKPGSESESESESSVPIQQYLDLFVAAPAAQAVFLQHLMEVRPGALDSDALLALLEVYLPRSGEMDDPGDDWTPPGGFGGDPDEPGGDGGASGGDGGASGGDPEKALRVLDNVRLKDVPLALRVCQDHGFQQGVAKLYERYGMHSHILQTQLEASDYPAALETCRRFGGERPQLWLEALRSLTKQLSPPADTITAVLDNIEKGKLASSMEVVDILVESPTLELGAVRDYMKRVLTADQDDIDADSEAAEAFATEAQTIRDQISMEESSAMVFQRTSCAACSQPLELPSVHFFCPHSFHQHCFQSYADREDACPLCLPEYTQLRRQLSSQAGAAEETVLQLYAELDKADDKFSVVADYFGRGVFSRPEAAETPAPAPAGQPPPPAHTVSSYLASDPAAEPVGAAAEARLRLTDRSAAASTGPFGGESEARVRASERRSQQAPTVAEGRLRAAQASQVAPSVAEGRLRAAQASQVAPSVAEGRLRAAQVSQVAPSVAEGRLRVAQTSQVTSTVPEGRMRAAEMRHSAAVAPQPAEDRARALVRRPEMAVQAAAAKPAAPKPAAPNPFEEGPNPFEDDGDADATNPFNEDPSDSNNPFAEDMEEYDKTLNPFEE